MNSFASNKTKERGMHEKLPLVFAIVGLITLGNRCEAAPFSEDKVRRAVEHWVRRVPAERRADAAVEKTEPLVQDGSLAGYVVHLAKGGYCLAGADSLVLPVYWYSPTGRYDPSNPGPVSYTHLR